MRTSVCRGFAFVAGILSFGLPLDTRPASAQDVAQPMTAGNGGACADDLKAFCKDIEVGVRPTACLAEHKDQLSAPCRYGMYQGDNPDYSAMLAHAVSAADAEGASAILAAGADANDERVLDALVWVTCKRMSEPVLRTLLSKGANVPANASKKMSKCATKRGQQDIIALIQKAEAGEPIKSVEEEESERVTQEADKISDEARQAGSAKKVLARYLEAIGRAPAGGELDLRLREKVIDYIRSLNSAPPVPEDAKSHARKGLLYVKKAEDDSDIQAAVSELQQACRAAPWWPSAYSNLALVQEKARQFDHAIESLKLYLLAAPEAPDRKMVETKVDELSVEKEMARRHSVRPSSASPGHHHQDSGEAN